MAFQLNSTFDSFALFSNAKRRFEHETYANFVIKNSHKLLLRNNHSQQEIDQFVYGNIHFKCKFGGVLESTSNQRNTNTFKSVCPAEFKVLLKTINGVKVLKITEFSVQHDNHVLSRENFLALPKQRRESIADNSIFVQNSISVKAGIRPTQAAINTSTNTRGAVLLKDLYNYRNKIQNESDLDIGQVQLLINEMLKIPHSTVKVFSDDNIVRGIFFQEDSMKLQYATFPEILFCDATYNISKEKMALQVLMVLDGNGDSQIVALFIIDSENIITMTAMLKLFRENNENCEKTDIIMVDKGAANIASFNEVYPNAEIHLCVFHIHQIFHRQISVKDMNIDLNTKKKAIEILSSMIYARNQDVYDRLYGELQLLNSPKILEYFNNHWHPEEYRKMWVGYYVNKRKHYQNRTNNRVESFNQKLKHIISSYAPLKEFFKDLTMLLSSISSEKQIKYVVMGQKHPTQIQDEPHTTFRYRSLLTPFAFEHVKEQIRRVENYAFTHVDEASAHSVRNGTYIYTDGQTCNCTFFSMMSMVCRHILKYRRIKGMDEFEQNTCDKRWYRSTVAACLQKTIEHRSFAATQFTQNNPSGLLTKKQKVKRASAMFEKVTATLLNVSSADFEAALQQYELSNTLLSQGTPFRVVPNQTGK